MSDIKQQTVTAADKGAFQQLLNLLFKGIDKILDSAAEYENDMGVLKQVNKIKVTDGTKEYEVKIKLSPVKDKKGIFYVELESDYPDFNSGDVSNKLAKIENNNMDDFNELIMNVLKRNKLELVKNDNSSPGNESKISTEEIECYDQDKYEDWMDGQGEEPEIITLSINKTLSEVGTVQLGINASNGVELTYEGTPVNESPATENVPEDKVSDLIDDILEENHLIRLEDEEISESESQDNVQQSKHLDVSLSYIKSSNEVKLNAIYANYNIEDALNSLDLAINNDEFMNVLTEDPQCFRITDGDNDLDIDIIEAVDVSSVNGMIHDAMNCLISLLDGYYVDMDAQQQAGCDELLPYLQRCVTLFNSENTLEDNMDT